MLSQELSNFGLLQLLIGLPLGFLYYVALIRSVPKPKTGSTKPQVGHDTLHYFHSSKPTSGSLN